MSNLYVACGLGAEKGRIMLGALQKEGLSVSEAGEFQDLILHPDQNPQWDVARMYQQVLTAVRGIVAHEEPVRGISFHSSVADTLLFEGNGALMSPAARTSQAATAAELNKILASIGPEAFYDQTGTQPLATSALCQLAAEPGRRLKKADHALSLADGFNYLFVGVPRADYSQAHISQLYNPVAKEWSEPLLKVTGVPRKLLPQVVPAGTVLGQVRPEIARDSGLQDARVVTTCSYELAASLASLTIADPENWAFLAPGETTLLGTRMDGPSINDISREMKYSNLLGYGDSVGFYKKWIGLKLVDQCRRAWSQQDRALDNDVLMHLATSATPFESFINPGDPRFETADDLPQAIQAFCRETGQEVPRKPGPVLRCVLESLALEYRKGLLELEYIASTTFTKLYVLGGRSNHLLNHFLANAFQVPVAVVSTDAAAVGNVMIQALALGHVTSLEQARELIRPSLKVQTINPHATAWTEAYDRFLGLNVV